MTSITDTPAPLPGFAEHDHGDCIASALRSVEETCDANGLRLTPVRRAALEILLHGHRALGAYAVLDALRERGFGSQPPVAYRALDFLVAHGFAHKIERLNAFVACVEPGDDHAPVFMICRVCDAVAEAPAAPARAALSEVARASGFTVERAMIEVLGVCPGCAEAAPA
ncbi:Fur family transcriptional regulator [Jannaschia seohaensis]|uniref:Fur family transcriptional regulator, zinc uptake regulator n=1 Tax=Jannaschia seohaensis TaxID=475081 RepID=A0A2Y9AZZ1_9RHOB|nr:Fur family transcriptional regulator [Jannaschia seohaensis]PWJ17531.1 Fur family zinc uptake transcriptional regulator [Jannaschia seohaensis]SSA47669.1 Fur family transcriptional regulator, zinc uptake regulator [Jannaschia seohaensis]